MLRIFSLLLALICNVSEAGECHRLSHESDEEVININVPSENSNGVCENPPDYNEISIISNSESPSSAPPE